MFKGKGKRNLAVFLATVMVLAQLPTVAFAREPYGPLPNEITVKGQKLYNIYAGETEKILSTESEATFFSEMLKQKGLLEKWAGLAYTIYNVHDSSKNANNAVTHFDNSGKGFDEVFGKGHYIDLIDAFVNKQPLFTPPSGKKDKYQSTGLSLANNLKEVETKMGDLIAGALGRKLKGIDIMNHNPVYPLRYTQETLNEAENKRASNPNETVLYTLVGGVNSWGGAGKYSYNGFGIAFYDFKTVMIIPEEPYNLAIGDMTVEEAIANGNTDGFSRIEESNNLPIDSVKTKNDSPTPMDASHEIGVEESLRVMNSLMNSDTREFGNTIDAGVSFEQTFKKTGAVSESETSIGAHLDYGWSTNHAMETAKLREEETVSTYKATDTISFEVPPYSIVPVISTRSSSTQDMSYDCPVSITYKVAIFSVCGEFYDDNVKTQSYNTAEYYQHSFYTVFGNDIDGSDAITNLYERGIKNQNVENYEEAMGITRGDRWRKEKVDRTPLKSLNWNAMKNGGSPKSKAHPNMGNAFDITKRLTDARPMSATGATMTEKISVSEIKKSEAEPLFPLTKIVTPKDDRFYEFKPGERWYSDTIELTALNGKPNGVYYGFDQRLGKWKIVDENYQPLSPSIATLNYDPMSQRYELTAVGPGKGYLTYEINEDTYTYYGSKVYAKNEDVEKQNIPFTILDFEPFSGTIEAAGEIELTVGADAVDIDTLPGVSATAYDTTGREVEAEFNWESKELANKGIEVSGDMIRVTKPGTFNVRAVYNGAYSNYIPVTATEAAMRINVRADGLTRGSLALILYQNFGSPGLMGNTGFSDVDDPANPAHRYKESVLWVTQSGLLKGFSATEFGVNEPVTKQQFLAVLYRLAGYLNIDIKKEITESIEHQVISGDISPWARKAIQWALAKGLITEEDLRKDSSTTLDEPVTLDEYNELVDPIIEEAEAEASAAEPVTPEESAEPATAEESAEPAPAEESSEPAPTEESSEPAPAEAAPEPSPEAVQESSPSEAAPESAPIE